MTSRRHPQGRQVLALVSLVLMAMLWGSTFFSMKAFVGQVPVPDMLAVRFVIAAAVVGVLARRHWRMPRRTLVQGVVIGTIYGVAQLVQTYGLARTPASVSGFITGLYVVVTPFLAAWLLRERIPEATWVAVVLATVGLGVLSIGSGSLAGSARLGEALTLVSAVLYAGHIIAVDRFSSPATALQLTNVELVVVALICLVAALPGGITPPHTGVQWTWMLYFAVIAGAIPIFLQIWAQSYVESTTAAVIMAGEPVWAATFAVLFGGEVVSWRMVIGGAAMVGAMVLVTVMPRLKPAARAATPAGLPDLRADRG
ncbi:MAG TPA: DMT family transporter [Propionibacteriaceae bacterium]|nr:DMT family transporter [Propionibacteriaceae bacterium]